MNHASDKKIEPEKTHLALEHKHDRPLTACHWDRSGRHVFFGAEDHLVHRFTLADQSVTSMAAPAHNSWVRALGTSPDGEVLYSGGYDGRLVWWPAAAQDPKPIRVVDAHRGWIRALAVAPGGDHFATCGNDHLVKLWDAAEGELVHQFSGHESHVYNVAFTPDGGSLVSCDLHGVVKAWDVNAGGLHRDVAAAESLHHYDETFRADIGGARSIAFRGDGKQLALGGITNVTNAFAGIGEVAVVLLEMSSGEVARQLETEDKVRGTAWGVAHHPDGFWIGLSGGGGGGWLYLWKGDAEHEFFKLKLKNDGRDMSLSADHAQVAVAHADAHLRIYSLHGKSA